MIRRRTPACRARRRWPAAALPRFAIGQADQRPSHHRRGAEDHNTNTLEPLREQSNVGERVMQTSIWEGLTRPQLPASWSPSRSWRRRCAASSDSVSNSSCARG